jgi:hypothetical protein
MLDTHATNDEFMKTISKEAAMTMEKEKVSYYQSLHMYKMLICIYTSVYQIWLFAGHVIELYMT